MTLLEIQLMIKVSILIIIYVLDLELFLDEANDFNIEDNDGEILNNMTEEEGEVIQKNGLMRKSMNPP